MTTESEKRLDTIDRVQGRIVRTIRELSEVVAAMARKLDDVNRELSELRDGGEFDGDDGDWLGDAFGDDG